jgi:hypothetical protein
MAEGITWCVHVSKSGGAQERRKRVKVILL